MTSLVIIIYASNEPKQRSRIAIIEWAHFNWVPVYYSASVATNAIYTEAFITDECDFRVVDNDIYFQDSIWRRFETKWRHYSGNWAPHETIINKAWNWSA